MLLRYHSEAKNFNKDIEFSDNEVSGKFSKSSFDGLTDSDDRL